MHWALKRVVRFFAVLWAVVTSLFFIVQLMPGGPADYIRAKLIRSGVPRDVIQTRIQAYLLFEKDKPMFQQYLDYLWNLLHGNLGQSILKGAPVAELIADSLPYTIFLMSQALVLTFAIGISLGALIAFFEGSKFDSSTTIISTVLSSVPYYIVALILLMLLASGVVFTYFPLGTPFGLSVEPGFNIPFIINLYYHATLPILSMVLAGFGAQAITMRANSISVLETTYLRSGRLRGLGTWRLASRYVGRNAILPMYTGFMISIGFMFGGAIIIEQIFSYPGIGQLIYQATRSRDYPLLIGCLLVLSVVVLIMISIAEVTYGLLDPRIRSENGRNGGSSSTSSLKLTLRRLRAKLLRFFGGQKQETATDGGNIRQIGDLPDTVPRPSVPQGDAGRKRKILQRKIIAPLKILWDDWRGRFGMIIFIGYVLIAAVGVYIFENPSLNSAPRGVLPFQSFKYILGTGGYGQDLLAAMVHATPPMLKMILAGSVFATGVATLIGTISGFRRGALSDRLLMFFTDIQLVIPGLPLVLVLATIFQPKNPYVIGLLLSLDAWPGLARNVRSEVLSIRKAGYVDAASLMGDSLMNIIRKDILPNIMPYVLINFSNSARRVIYGSVALYFLGILPFTQPNWGVILDNAYSEGALYRPDLIHWLLVPMAIIVIFSLALILISQSADKLFNPRLKAKKSGPEQENSTDLRSSD